MTTDLHARRQWGLAQVADAARDHDVLGPGRSRRQTLLETFRLDRPWPGRSKSNKSRSLCSLYGPAAWGERGFEAVSRDVGQHQPDDIAGVIGDGSDHNALVAAAVGDPTQQGCVLGLQRQAARLSDVDVAGRVVDRPGEFVEGLNESGRLDLGEVVRTVSDSPGTKPPAPA